MNQNLITYRITLYALVGRKDTLNLVSLLKIVSS